MSLLLPENSSPIDEKQGRLMQFAALFLLVYSIVLTLAPAARIHSWEATYRWNHWIGFLTWLIATAVVHRQIIRFAPERDPFLFPIAALLAGWGLLSIWRLDWVMGARQTAWLAVSLGVFTFGLRNSHLLVFLRRYKYLWLIGGLGLTALTFLFGTYPGGYGPRLWLGCCGVYFQPSEPLKLLLIIYLSAYLADKLPVSFRLMQMLPPTLILGGTALALLVRQRDLGTASLFILIYTVVIYLASQRWRILLVSFFTLLGAGIAGYALFDVVRIRVNAWLNPWLDPAGGSYQIVQSILAVASGGLLGTGPGMGSPGAVPVAHSDFIFASIAEEMGLLGAAGLLLLFALLVNRGFRAALFATNNYRRYLSAGITAYLAMQAIFIIGGNLRLLPLTGVTLPFVSYGGSSLLTAFISVLLLVLVSDRGEEETAPLPNAAPYLLASGGLLAGLLALTLGTGWWSVVRSADLQARPDNPRRAIADRFVPRGTLLDRSGTPISYTGGAPGNHVRVYEYPPLSATTGYNNPLYGLAGLEAGLDDYLRGLAENDEMLIWSTNLLYGQPPPGLDVRTTIELDLQKQADLLLEGHRGAAVLLNASTGEILAMASHPYFDPNRLETEWNTLVGDPSAPLLNRATQGQYPPGAALGPFLLAYSDAQGDLPGLSEQLIAAARVSSQSCAVVPTGRGDPGSMVASGCPAPIVALSQAVGEEQLEALLNSLGFFEAPGLPFAIVAPASPTTPDPTLVIQGQDGLIVTPLQMARAAAALSSGGTLPPVQIAAAVLTPNAVWKALPSGESRPTFLIDGTEEALAAMSLSDQPYWQTVSLARSEESELTWYLGGTLPGSQGTPLAVAIVLEENNPTLARTIGLALLQEAQQ